MDINLNTSRVSPGRMALGENKVREMPRATETQIFSGAAALEQAIQNTPDARPEKVARAKELIASPNYPPTETIVRLSNLLAVHLEKK